MTIAYYTNVLSPHQLPLAREVVRLVGDENYHYVYRDELDQERLSLGWGDKDLPRWCMRGSEDSPELMAADLVYTGGLRPLGLLARRIAAGKKTFYVTERWFKPIRLFGINFPGTWRLLVPSYRKMARRMVELLNNPLCMCLAIGPWAKKDMLLVVRLFGQRGVDYNSKISDWGYFVAPSRLPVRKVDKSSSLRVLWVGRMIGWKRVDTIVKSVRWIHENVPNVQIALTLVGNGNKRSEIVKIVGDDKDIAIIDSVPISKVRELMRGHDVYVLASDENEGWGAVVNEALEEGMKVLGTYEAGASAAMLPDGDLFHSGDWRRLAELLARCAKEKRNGKLVGQSIGEWTPEKAAQRLVRALA